MAVEKHLHVFLIRIHPSFLTGQIRGEIKHGTNLLIRTNVLIIIFWKIELLFTIIFTHSESILTLSREIKKFLFKLEREKRYLDHFQIRSIKNYLFQRFFIQGMGVNLKISVIARLIYRCFQDVSTTDKELRFDKATYIFN